MFGSLSFLSKVCVIFGKGFEKTELNCSWMRLAFFTGSLVEMSLFLRSEIPTFSCFLFLIYDHSFLFDLSSENKLERYLSWVCLHVLWVSLLTSL